jgi:hypothetical protein
MAGFPGISSRQPAALEEGGEVRLAAHEVPEELGRVG